MEQRAEGARFEALLLGAERYLAGGGDPISLSPGLAQKLGLLPQGWFGGTLLSTGDSNPIFHSDVLLGPAQPNGIAVGIEGRYDALEPIIRNYGVDASQTYFPYPKTLSSTAASHAPAMMVMTFDRVGLEHAVLLLRECGKLGQEPAASTHYPLMMSFDSQGLFHAAALALAEPRRLDLDSKSHSKYSTPAIGTNSSAAMISR
jgi:hypothetical protein